MDSSEDESRTSKFQSERQDWNPTTPCEVRRPKPGKAERLQRREEKISLDLAALSRIATLDASDPSFYLHAAKALREPQIHLVKNAVQHLGADAVMGLLEKTREVQSTGGVRAANGQGLKTAGGVFFSLVKEAASPEVKALIFQSDKNAKKLAKREKRRLTASESQEFRVSPGILNLFPEINQ